MFTVSPVVVLETVPVDIVVPANDLFESYFIVISAEVPPLIIPLTSVTVNPISVKNTVLEFRKKGWE